MGIQCISKCDEEYTPLFALTHSRSLIHADAAAADAVRAGRGQMRLISVTVQYITKSRCAHAEEERVVM